MTLNWNCVGGAYDYGIYDFPYGSIYRSTTAGFTADRTTLVNNVQICSETDGGLSNGTTYYYKVTQSNTHGESEPSIEAEATPLSGLPSVPTNLTAVPGTRK